MSEDAKESVETTDTHMDDNEGEDEVMNLVSKEGKTFEVVKKNAMISVLVAVACGQDPNMADYSCKQVRSEILDIVIEYMNQHEGMEPDIVEKPITSTRMKDVAEPWDAAWIDKISDSNQNLYDLLMAAYHLDIKGLLHLASAKVASMIKGQPQEKLKEILAVN